MKRFDLEGNRHIKEAVLNGSLGTAVIFDGPSGFGKKAAAAYAAAALLCASNDFRPCGTCPSCRQALAGSNPDIELFNPEGKPIRVDDIRQLRLRSFMAPSQSPFKVFIINRADLMNMESQNAMLKVLEEPVSSVFILLTENDGALLSTVRSRCKKYTMEILPDGVIADYIKRVYAPLAASFPHEKLMDIISQSHGSMGTALGMLDSSAPKSLMLAKEFLSSLGKGPLTVMEACLSASSLNRAEYADFCTHVSAGLASMALKNPGTARSCTLIYDYMQKQSERLDDNNASVFALSSQLAAYCGMFLQEN